MDTKMNWFEKHINWTWVLVYAIISIFLLYFNVYPNGILYYVIAILLYGITGWALWRKKRSGLWILIPIAVLFLSNKRIEKPNENNN
jgi:hypothetical protein